MKNQTPAKNAGKASARVRLISLLALLSAMSIVLGKFLQIPIGDSIRISFENLPVLFAGIVFGPAAGAAVGAVEDVVGCLLAGFALNPIITLGSISIGFVSGLIGKILFRKPARIDKYGALRIVCAVFLAHLIGSVLIKSTGLWVYYKTPFTVLSLRVPIYLLANTAAESALIFTLLQSAAIRSVLRKSAPAGANLPASTVLQERTASEASPDN